VVALDVHILIMNEDSSRAAYEALRHLIRRICQLLCPDLGTQHLVFSPTPEELEGCVRAGRWQSSNPRHRRQQVDLAQSIASQIATDRGFVAFHYDGDCAWADRRTCVHDPHFETNVRQRVRALLGAHMPAEKLEELMSKLLVLKPFYCLEAWTYQNFTRARALCEALGNPPGSELLDAWEADPGLLDEVIGVPNVFPLEKHHNIALTEKGYPAARVYELGKSFTASVDAALSCKLLLDALSRCSTSITPS
jgi:hypothetical protein